MTKRANSSPRLPIPPRTELSRKPLVTTRTVLEPIHSGMYRLLYRAVEDSRAFLEPWLPWVPFNDSPEASLRYTEASEADWSTGSALRFSVRLHHLADVIGVVTLENCSDLHRNCDLGYWLRREHTGQGLMTEAATKILEFAFQTLGMHRVRCAAAQDNHPSKSVIKRLGFGHEGIAREAERVAGRWVTHDVFSRLASDPDPILREPTG